MPQGRPHIPVAVDRAVREEAGYGCAIPVCGRPTGVQIAHIEPWSETRDDSFDNLILLCANHHDDYDKGRISRASIRNYKLNLSVINHRFSSLERRALEDFLERGGRAGLTLVLAGGHDLLMRNLVRDGHVTREAIGGGQGRTRSGSTVIEVEGTIRNPRPGAAVDPAVDPVVERVDAMVRYTLTEAGASLLARYQDADVLG